MDIAEALSDVLCRDQELKHLLALFGNVNIETHICYSLKFIVFCIQHEVLLFLFLAAR